MVGVDDEEIRAAAVELGGQIIAEGKVTIGALAQEAWLI